MGTKLQYHKIPKVELTTCTVEQKIAYNYAFQYEIIYGDKFRKLDMEMHKGDVITDIIRLIMQDVKSNVKTSTKYNIDAISCALRAGLQKYMEHPVIALDYNQIGIMFPANYL